MRIERVTKTYVGRTVLDLADVSFAGQGIVAVLGANGSGKTTLVRILAGTLVPDPGSIIFAERADTAYLPQNSYAFSFSARQNALLGTSRRGVLRAHPDAAVQAQMDAYFDALALSPLRKQNARGFSGGEAAKLSLLRVLMTDRKNLLLDEPTAAMDVASLAAAETLICDYHAAHGGVTLLVTHSLAQAKRLADHILFLDRGRLSAFGTPDDVLNQSPDPAVRAFVRMFGE